ncbi:hypothetical protein KP509_11G030600 [Ceratopteris richardii]|nr:hypothetical protein KP509_11G030600 [Ceratopteris richardii]
MSFVTCFSFEIITTAPDGLSGSGFAFFISVSQTAPPHSTGRYLGLSPIGGSKDGQYDFFAVEFDTHKSDGIKDPSGSHIGIDINSVNSLAVADTSPASRTLYPTLYLYNNYTFTAWVEYNASTALIRVWMINSTTPTACALDQPSDKRILALSSFYNLSTLFRNRLSYVGFSATNNASEDGMEGVALFSWSFSTEGDNIRGTKNDILKLVLEISLPLIVVVLSLSCLYVYWRLRTRSKMLPQPDAFPQTDEEKRSTRGQVAQQFSLIELSNATRAFSEEFKIAEGTFGIVYKGILEDGSLVAVKKLKQSVRKEQEFEAEMHVIHECRHRNLLQLRGWCYEKDEVMLVYDFMEKGSLDSYIHGKNKASTAALDSKRRLEILKDVARALEYLHFESPTRIVHRDVKAANVILTNKFEALLADFGLSRLMPPDEKELIIDEAAGTLGSIAPEVFDGNVSDKADVYSYGVLSLEVAYGRKMFDRSLDYRHLLDWVWSLKEQGRLLEELDPVVRTSMYTDHSELWSKVVHIALLCCHPTPDARPSMKQVYQVLEESSEDSQKLLLESRLLIKPSYRGLAPHMLSSEEFNCKILED